MTNATEQLASLSPNEACTAKWRYLLPHACLPNPLVGCYNAFAHLRRERCCRVSAIIPDGPFSPRPQSFPSALPLAVEIMDFSPFRKVFVTSIRDGVLDVLRGRNATLTLFNGRVVGECGRIEQERRSGSGGGQRIDNISTSDYKYVGLDIIFGLPNPLIGTDWWCLFTAHVRDKIKYPWCYGSALKCPPRFFQCW